MTTEEKYPLVARIDSPGDLRLLGREELPRLAQEVRQLIQEVVARNSGHLASNLGAVELTIALHYVFDTPRDKLIWDVGHQCYTHKILTGRRERFQSLRQRGGLSGFPSPQESPYDEFLVGHSGTSLSTALGLLLAQERGESGEPAAEPARVVAVIGDGSIGSGMALEALNHIGHLGRPLLVVLNDNRMSISRTVGALANYLNAARAAPLYNELKREVRALLDAVPVVGHPMESALEFVKDAVRRTLIPGRMFEDLGFRYFGPIDGHDLDLLIETLNDLRRLPSEKPILLHLITEKGHGFTPAARDPTTFHSSPPFETGDGDVLPRLKLGARVYTDAFAEALVEEGRRDPRIVAITAAMPTGTGLARFAQVFPDRFYDVGICEQHAVGLAAGLARGGRRPVVAIYSTFSQRACDQVFHELCLQGAPVVLALDRAGLVGGDGPTHQGLYDIGYLRPFPGLTLAAPRDGAELAALLGWALEQPRPVVIRYPKAPLPEGLFSAPPSPIEPGRAEVLAQGADAVLVAYGAAVAEAARARSRLAEEGWEVGLVNARFAKPVDEETLEKCLVGSGLVVTIEDGVLAGGFGSAVAEVVAQMAEPRARLLRLGVPDVLLSQGSREELLREVGLDAEGIARQVGEALRAGRGRRQSRRKKTAG